MRYIPVIKLIKLGRKKKDIYFLFESPKSPYLTYIFILVKSSEQSPCKRAIIDIHVPLLSRFADNFFVPKTTDFAQCIHCKFKCVSPHLCINDVFRSFILYQLRLF